MQAHTAKARLFFSNSQKPERERTVCRAFLRAIGVLFEEREILASNREPVDVAFREARFQIREVLDRCRGDEYRDKQALYQSARRMEEVMVPWRSPVRMSFDEMAASIAAALEWKAEKYRSGCADLDALVYINLANPPRFLNPASPPQKSVLLEAQGWRSISILFPPHGIVVAATPRAPEFILTRVQKVMMECEDPDDLWGP